MIPVKSYRSRRVAVFGLGATGRATAQALLAGGAELLVWDDEPARRQAVPAARPVQPGPETWRGVRAVVLSPGVPLSHPAPHPVVRLAHDLGAEVLGDIELFARTLPEARVAAITGTNGKSTTTALLGHLLRKAGRQVAVGANLGQPVLSLDPLPDDGVYVLELSSYQIDLTRSLRPRVAVLLNLSPDHLDRHGDMAGYIAAKQRLLEMLAPGGLAIVGVDDPDSRTVAETMRRRGTRVLPVSGLEGPAGGVGAEGGKLVSRLCTEPAVIADLAGLQTLRGSHNAQNAAAASAAALALGLQLSEVAAGLASFAGLAHRMEPVGRVGRVRFVNDSKATNADAAARALAAFERIHWIAGGRPKAGGITSLTPWFERIAGAYLIGEAADAFAATLKGRVPVRLCGSLDRAVAAAYAAAAADDADEPVVLLSPACASFDQFASFEQRGDRFRELVAALDPRAEAPRQAAGGQGR